MQKSELKWAGAILLALALGACSSSESTPGGSTTPDAGSGGSAGSGAMGGTGGFGASGGTGGLGASGGTGGLAGTGGTAGSAGSAGAAGQDGGASGGSAGSGGADAGTDADAGPTWPTCDSAPSNATAQTIPQIWTADPATPSLTWVSGAYITAISGGGCTANSACQIFLQQDETYASLAAGAQHAIRMWISATTATHFVGLAVGDQVNALGDAFRYTSDGQNELLIRVTANMPGCAKKVGTGNPTPITGVALTDLTVSAYENTTGPLLVQVSGVTGKPGPGGQIFGIWVTGVGIGDAGPNGLVSVSPYFLSGNAFAGLPTDGQTAVNFQTVTGVFGLFTPATEAGNAPQYVVLYPRAMSELTQ
jgi:hypothetical protein